jgi:nickel superoxide dismutase
MFHQIFTALDERFGFARAQAHCDIPCGIYDPGTAQIAALTVVRMMDLMAEAEAKGHDNHLGFINSMARCIAVKEEHAEKAKHEVRVIWGDYIKPEHLAKHPELTDLVFKIMKLGSRVRQTVDRQAGLDFVEAINQFAAIFWETKGITIKRAKAPYAPALEMVYPAL